MQSAKYASVELNLNNFRNTQVDKLMTLMRILGVMYRRKNTQISATLQKILAISSNISSVLGQPVNSINNVDFITQARQSRALEYVSKVVRMTANKEHAIHIENISKRPFEVFVSYVKGDVYKLQDNTTTWTPGKTAMMIKTHYREKPVTGVSAWSKMQGPILRKWPWEYSLLDWQVLHATARYLGDYELHIRERIGTAAFARCETSYGFVNPAGGEAALEIRESIIWQSHSIDIIVKRVMIDPQMRQYYNRWLIDVFIEKNTIIYGGTCYIETSYSLPKHTTGEVNIDGVYIDEIGNWSVGGTGCM